MRDQYASRLVRFVVTELARRADPDKAAATAAYMKTEMPFYGVQKPGRVEIVREVTTRMPPEDLDEYRDGVASLWSLSHREEKYLAIAYARSFPAYVALRQLDLYRQMLVEGAWWDFVDDVAANLVGRIHRAEPERMRPRLWESIGRADRWW